MGGSSSSRSLVALDTETTGVDLRHGARPFLVTIAEEDGITFWEWDVDPLTRKPQVPLEDLEEIQETLNDREVVLQNPKFDLMGLSLLFRDHNLTFQWDWSRIWDTLLAGHLLASNHPHDLASMAIEYLGVNIRTYEDKLQIACNKARRDARRLFPDWRIADKALPEMPSARGSVWKYDLWLLRALIDFVDNEYYEQDEWATLCSDYANADSATTLTLFKVQREKLKERNLWEIYLQRLKILPVVYALEMRGVTLSQKRLRTLVDKFSQRSQECAEVCVDIAKDHKFDLTLPKSGNNLSLRSFMFDVLEAPAVSRSEKTGDPSLNRAAMEHYAHTFKGEPLRFINSLMDKRKVDTALNYLEGYQRFWQGNGSSKSVWKILYPSLNPTGTDTLRMSSQHPNSQNCSKQEGYNLRYCFGPAPGREWWALDYDNLELRIPAYESGEPAMLELFEHPEAPPYYGSYHLLVFDILHPQEFKRHGAEVKKIYKATLYQWTKNGNFADLYGAMESSGTADRAFHVEGAQRKVARRLTKKAELNRYWIDFAERHGYVETLPDKTVDPERGYPLLCTRSRWGKILPTVPLNYHVQGTACWIMGQAMIRVHEYLSQYDDCHIIMNVHDEVVLDFPYRKNKGNLSKIRTIRRIMEQCGDDVGVKLTCGVDYHPRTWSEGGEIV